MNDIPDVTPSYISRFADRRNDKRRDTILVKTEPGVSRPPPKPVPEDARKWRPRDIF